MIQPKKTILLNNDDIILSQLRKNAKTNLKILSKEQGIPLTTIYDRIRKYDKGLIQKQISLINFNTLGLYLEAFISLKPKENEKCNLVDFLSKYFRINSMYRTNQQQVYLIHALFKDYDEYDMIITRLKAEFDLEDQHTFFINSKMKHEHFLSEHYHFDKIDHVV